MKIGSYDFKCRTVTSEPTKVCSCCRQELPTDSFYRRGGKRAGIQSQCKICQKGLSREWQLAHPEQHRRNSRAVYARKQGLTLSAWDRLMTLKQMQRHTAHQIAKIEATRKMPKV